MPICLRAKFQIQYGPVSRERSIMAFICGLRQLTQISLMFHEGGSVSLAKGVSLGCGDIKQSRARL